MKSAIAGMATGLLTRERIKRYLVQRFYTRFHMSLILLSSGLTAMLGNWMLLHAVGVHDMWIRYPVAVGLSYLTFLCGVWLWLRYVGLAQGAPNVVALDSADGMDLSFGGGGGCDILPEALGKGGGQFGGGGASGSWGDGPVQSLVGKSGGVVDSTASAGGSSGSSFSLGGIGELDGEGLVLLLLALALAASILLASGYVIWFAPDILGEAAFGATLAAGLAKSAKGQEGDGWVGGVVKKTWWPFAIVLVLAQAVAVFAAVNYPAASTLRQAILLALA